MLFKPDRRTLKFKIIASFFAALLVIGVLLAARAAMRRGGAGIAGTFDAGQVRLDRPFVVPDDLPRTEEEWRRRLTPEQYYILRQQGTEVPFSSPLDHETRPGTYVTADCGEPVFRSEQKYDSGTGWPSFWRPISDDAVVLREDNSMFLERRIEVLSKCGGHLGHVFNDGPPPTGKRYCMNGDALIFIPDQPAAAGR